MQKSVGLYYEMKLFLNSHYANNVTRRAYKKQAERFCDYIKKIFITANEARTNPQAVLQLYANDLVAQGLSADTVHTYLSFPCAFFNLPMSAIDKPKRLAAEISRSRGEKNLQGAREATLACNARIVAFQQHVGVRRAELTKLNGMNLKQDENGCWCVEVQRGKGGKYQLQRILPEDVEFVKQYFDGTAKPLFGRAELNNKIDFHSMRSAHARIAYDYYLHLCESPVQRAQLQQELRDRFAIYNKHYIYRCSEPSLLVQFEDDMEGEYRLRGSTAAFAKSKGRPVTYDKTALMAVSVFHLSHWRCDVTVKNYMLA
ncbi:MAG: hypothetical protein RR234_09750 [Christensenella sp.]